jgi:hypothetical protein
VANPGLYFTIISVAFGLFCSFLTLESIVSIVILLMKQRVYLFAGFIIVKNRRRK